MARLNDPRRRRALARAGLLEPHSDETFDRLAQEVKETLGVPVATVAIGNAWNAGLLAAQILGVADEELLDRVRKYKDGLREMVLKKKLE